MGLDWVVFEAVYLGFKTVDRRLFARDLSLEDFALIFGMLELGLEVLQRTLEFRVLCLKGLSLLSHLLIDGIGDFECVGARALHVGGVLGSVDDLALAWCCV